MYRFEEVPFNAEFESALLGLSDDMGTMTLPTETSEDEGAPASDVHQMPTGLGLALLYTEQALELSTITETCVQRDADPGSSSAIGLGISLAEDAHASDKKKFHHSMDTEACTVHGAASSSTFAPGAPRFNTFVLEEYAILETVTSDWSTTAPPAPQPNNFVFEQSPARRVLPQSPGSSSVSSSSGSDEYIGRAAALFVVRLPVLMYAIRAHKTIFTSVVNRISVTTESEAPTVWNSTHRFFSGYSAVATRKNSFKVNFISAVRLDVLLGFPFCYGFVLFWITCFSVFRFLALVPPHFLFTQDLELDLASK
ncbi:hypothetical protein FIBSPDRAFT_867710 [Athelia psychrophila]|uniref:Uncharacterized protein n=1 Tax=Athelia psychrophila TaxID=1759441 RepID=A0A166DNT2_9AGAM|nr:hypothetical protein FIBSPDRAFT_867710 [Fibularhizoctonia sp. CBS 109695]